MSLRLARMPCSARHSRRLRAALAAAPVLFVHDFVHAIHMEKTHRIGGHSNLTASAFTPYLASIGTTVIASSASVCVPVSVIAVVAVSAAIVQTYSRQWRSTIAITFPETSTAKTTP